MTEGTRKPRIALMGEFSAGKSTLSNLLLGARPLPEKVTATRLSPVWMAHGNQEPFRIDLNGNEEPVDLSDLESIDLDTTRVIRVFFEADVLQVCDMIDFPGISDPNMSSEVWQRVLTEVDAVLWCTHATQAWRQSEAAVWDTMPDAVRERSVLLITRFDKLKTERDRARVLSRLRKEVAGKFAATFPISLTQALEAGEDYDAFNASGGGAFLEHLITMVGDLGETVEHMDTSIYQSAVGTHSVDASETSAQTKQEAVKSQDHDGEFKEEYAQAAQNESDSVGDSENIDEISSKVMPRRVRPAGALARSERPRGSRQTGESMAPPLPTSPKQTTDPDQLRSVFGSEGG
ncbi:MAG: dynamin family protein [Pseudomonadota bacterium]